MPQESVQFSQTKHHRRSVAALILAVVIFGVLIVGYIYNGESSSNLVSLNNVVARPTSQQQMVAQLKQSPTSPLTTAEKQQIISRLQNAGKPLSNAQKLDIIHTLQAQ